MDKQHLDQLVKGVSEMKRHIAGKPVPCSKSSPVTLKLSKHCALKYAIAR
jgi:hypothetical protein